MNSRYVRGELDVAFSSRLECTLCATTAGGGVLGLGCITAGIGVIDLGRAGAGAGVEACATAAGGGVLGLSCVVAGAGVDAAALTAVIPATVALRAVTAGMPCTVAFFGGSGRDAGGAGVSGSGRTVASPDDPNGDVCIGARIFGAGLSSSIGCGLPTGAAAAGAGVAAGADDVSGASSGALRTKYRSRVAGSTAR